MCSSPEGPWCCPALRSACLFDIAGYSAPHPSLRQSGMVPQRCARCATQPRGRVPAGHWHRPPDPRRSILPWLWHASTAHRQARCLGMHQQKAAGAENASGVAWFLTTSAHDTLYDPSMTVQMRFIFRVYLCSHRNTDRVIARSSIPAAATVKAPVTLHLQMACRIACAKGAEE